MPTEIYLIKSGMTMTEGVVEEWYIADGDSVQAGELLYRLETEKINLDVDAEASGVVRHLVGVGETQARRFRTIWVQTQHPLQRLSLRQLQPHPPQMALHLLHPPPLLPLAPQPVLAKVDAFTHRQRHVDWPVNSALISPGRLLLVRADASSRPISNALRSKNQPPKTRKQQAPRPHHHLLLASSREN